MNPNFVPWRTRPSNLTSVPLALPPMLHPDLPYRPQTLCWHMPISGSPPLLCIPSGPLFPTSSCSCLSSSVDFSEAWANYPNRSTPTPMPILISIYLFSIYFLQITYHHLKNIICYIYCLSIQSHTISRMWAPWGHRLICSPRGSQDLELCRALSRDFINIHCLNCYCLQLPLLNHWYPHCHHDLSKM